MKAAILFALLFVLSSVFAQSWSSCGSAGDEFTIGTVTITPDPIVKGQNVTISVKGTMNVEVQTGTASVKVVYGIITVFNKQENICDPPELPCPIPQGAWSKDYTVLLPSDSPSGTYKATADLTDTTTNKQILCVNADLKI